jgi:hypothetical protein
MLPNLVIIFSKGMKRAHEEKALGQSKLHLANKGKVINKVMHIRGWGP